MRHTEAGTGSSKKEMGGNVLWGFDFKILPTGVHGADHDGLKHIQGQVAQWT